MRLIDIEAEVCADCVFRDKCDRQTYCWVKAMQTVDAVPVVHCEKCLLHGNCITEDSFELARVENPFCCAGKRKEV